MLPSSASSSAFYVQAGAAAGGNGTQANPFSTLDQARLAMETSTVKTTFVEGGTYNLSSTLTLTGADSGETFAGVAGQTATITGSGLTTLVALNGSTNVTLQGLTLSGSAATPAAAGYGAIDLEGATRSTILADHIVNSGGDGISIGAASSSNVVSGNEIDNSGDSGIEIRDASNGNRIDSNIINGTSAGNTTGGGVLIHGVGNTTITHNEVFNTAGMGIGVEDYGGTSHTANGAFTIADNILYNNNLSSTDSGAIYVLDRSDIIDNGTVSMNFISEPNADPTRHQVGIYLDDYASGIAVRSNIVNGTLSFDLQLHGGNDDAVSNNIFDTGAGSTQVALIQSAPSNVAVGSLGTFNNDTISGNLFPSEHSAAGIPASYDFIGAPWSAVAISNNDYFGGNGMNAYPDSSAKYNVQDFANAAGNNYALGAGIGASSIGFTAIDESQIGLHPTGAHAYLS